MRPSIALTVLPGALVIARAARAERQRGDESRGQPGASFLQHRTDAVECAYRVGQDAPVDYSRVDPVFSSNIVTPSAEKDVDMPMREMVDAAAPNPQRMTRPWREISSQLQEPLAKRLGECGRLRRRGLISRRRRRRLPAEQHQGRQHADHCSLPAHFAVET